MRRSACCCVSCSPGRLAPRGHRMTSARGFALAAAVRVIHGIHDDAAIGRANALPAVASSLADGDVLMVRVAHLANGRHALNQHLAGLARGQLEQGVLALLGHQLRLRSRRTRHLRALARPQFNRMNRGAGGNVLERQSVSHQNVGVGAAADRRAHLEAHRLQDVALLAVQIMNQGDAGRAVWIVFDRRDAPWNPILLALEVDQAQHLLVAATLMAHGQVALIAASAGALLDRQKRLVRPIRRQVVINLRGLKAQGRRYRSVCLDCHSRLSLTSFQLPVASL